ncbi:hypothetical protein FF38_09396 [Lucilia cuprina]|uniref:Uncharacterized protein n=1 Tax=Lucilia cuprina TaxID=7375 RepID=A0A0L0CQC6_LUCCU|nr:hypothetical protein FF38_09396 [Lucilia cuprina]
MWTTFWACRKIPLGKLVPLVDLTLSSDGEHDITVVSFQNRLVDSSPPADEAKGTQSKLSVEGCSLGANDAKIVRQAAVEKSPSASPRDISKAGRTKLDRAKSGTRKSLAFLAKMKQRDPESFSAKENVLLGESSLKELQSADVVGLDVRPSTSANCRLDKRKEGGDPAAEALRALVGAADGSKTPPKKVPGVRGSKKPSVPSWVPLRESDLDEVKPFH